MLRFEVVRREVEPTRLQYLALQLAERTALAIESNERMLEQKTGGSAEE